VFEKYNWRSKLERLGKLAKIHTIFLWVIFFCLFFLPQKFLQNLPQPAQLGLKKRAGGGKLGKSREIFVERIFFVFLFHKKFLPKLSSTSPTWP
jgi:hypothetical protein